MPLISGALVTMRNPLALRACLGCLAEPHIRESAIWVNQLRESIGAWRSGAWIRRSGEWRSLQERFAGHLGHERTAATHEAASSLGPSLPPPLSRTKRPLPPTSEPRTLRIGKTKMGRHDSKQWWTRSKEKHHGGTKPKTE